MSTAVFEAFSKRFAERQRRTVGANDVARAEAQLGCRLSRQHRSFLLCVGSMRTPALLELVVAAEADLPALEGILSPADAVTQTALFRSAGMPADLILLGLDATGNGVCVRSGSESIVLFDHESGRTRPVAGSLKSLLSAYLALEEHE